MTKEDFVEKLSARCGISKPMAEYLFETGIELVKEALFAGETVTIKKFCTFSIKDKPARIARDIRKGEPVEVPAHKAPVCKFSSRFLDELKNH